jgi:DNA-binding response OmpR family regulator
MDGRGQRIMVVDNDRTVLELMQIRLDIAGYRAFILRSGRQALELVQQIRPAGMIIDAHLGETDGLEIVSAIRARHDDLHFPILVTGRGLTVDDVKRALANGAQNCLAKPFSGADAVERIGRLLQAAHKPAPHPHEGMVLTSRQPVVYV